MRLRREINTLATKAPDLYPVIVVHRKFRFVAQAFLRSSKTQTTIIASPEPDRLGLTIGRVLKSVRALVYGTEITSASTQQIDSVLELLNKNRDLALVGRQSLKISYGIHLRLAPNLVAIRSSAVNLIGDIDESYTDFQDIVDDLAGRLVEHNIPIAGLQHDVSSNPRTHPTIAQRFPWIIAKSSPLIPNEHERLIKRNIYAGAPMNVLVDLRSVSSVTNGTGQHAVRALRALAEQKELHVVALLSAQSSRLIPEECHQLGIQTLNQTNRSGEYFDLAFRPHQFDHRAEVVELRNLARFIVASQLDFIAADNPSYHSSVGAWQNYQRETIHALMATDGVSWLTAHPRDQAEARGINLERFPNRICGTVLVNPLDHQSIARPPIDNPYFAVVGASYHHKGRQYALEVLAHSIRLGWDGRIVISGWDPPNGSSRDREEETIRRFPELRASIVRFKELSTDDHLALVFHATALVQPSFDEGFGLVAAEAAALATPTFMLRRAGLSHVYPPDYDGWLEGNNAVEDAQRIVTRTTAPDPVRLTGLEQLSDRFSSSHFAKQTIALFQAVVGS